MINIVIIDDRERRIRGRSPMLVKGFRLAKMSQKTRGIGKRLNRYLVARLNAIVGIPP